MLYLIIYRTIVVNFEPLQFSYYIEHYLCIYLLSLQRNIYDIINIPTQTCITPTLHISLQRKKAPLIEEPFPESFRQLMLQ
jgi:hypothetical protein